MPQYFKFQGTRLFKKWGDYGDVLCNGIDLAETVETPLRLGRTGPFVPPITLVFLGHVVVPEESRKKIQAAGLNGVGDFRPLVVEKAVKSDWQTWDRNRDIDDDRYPFENEPEEYILHPPHDPAVAAAMPPLFTWHPIYTGEVVGQPGARRIENISASADAFRVQGLDNIYVSERGKGILAGIFGEWLEFEEASVLPMSTK